MMEDALQRSHADLEVRVQRRTAELQRLTEELSLEIETRKKYEAEIEVQSEKLMSEYRRREFLAAKLVSLLERDHREIANALHDEIGQILTGVSMELEALKHVPLGDGSIREEGIESVQNLLKDAVRRIRGLSADLRSDVLERFGLVPALRGLIKDVEERSGLEIFLFAKDVPERLQDGTDLIIYRIIQESLTNIVKHAGAGKAFVNVNRREGKIVVSIEDDGVGFSYAEHSTAENEKQDSLGIVIMRERAAQVGGSVYIESRPGMGTQVIAEMPLDRKDPGPEGPAMVAITDPKE
jgi:signal transduction histidine kinase